MSKVATRIIYIVLFLAFFVGMGVLLHVVKNERHGISCKEMQVSIPGAHRFITEEEVRNYVDNFYGIYVGQRLEDVNIGSIEKMLDTKAPVKKSQVWITDDGVLHVEVIQRTPVLRFESKGNGYYTDKEGNIFPLKGDYEAAVPVINCDPKLGLDPQWLAQTIKLVRKISESNVWNQRITGYSVEKNGDFILEGEDLKIIYGDFKDSARKFSAMERYFTTIAPKCAEDPYHVVNVKYKGQIICRKKRTDS